MVEFRDGHAIEASTEELMQFARRSAETCDTEGFLESIFRLGSRGIERDVGLELIATFRKECVCHHFMDDWEAEEQ